LCHALSYDGKETEGSVGTSRALEAAQAELAELVLEIDAELGAGVYQATKAELDGIDRGLKAAGEGKFESGFLHPSRGSGRRTKRVTDRSQYQAHPGGRALVTFSGFS
jgi:hypothetical protein